MKVISSILCGLVSFTSFSHLVSSAESVNYPKSVTISYELIGPGSPDVKPLATVFYDPSTLQYNLKSWTPPSLESEKSTTPQPQSSKLLRILLPNGSSTVTTLASFDSSLVQKLDLWLSPGDNQSIFSASVSSLTPPPLSAEEERLRKKVERAKAKGKAVPSAKPKPKSKPKKGAKVQQDTEDNLKAGSVQVNLIAPADGPVPKLGTKKPPQVDADGREIPSQVEQGEKSFFQKYWWIFLIAAVFTLGAGGER